MIVDMNKGAEQSDSTIRCVTMEIDVATESKTCCELNWRLKLL
jgi:hypothetical protein